MPIRHHLKTIRLEEDDTSAVLFQPDPDSGWTRTLGRFVATTSWSPFPVLRLTLKINSEGKSHGPFRFPPCLCRPEPSPNSFPSHLHRHRPDARAGVGFHKGDELRSLRLGNIGNGLGVGQAVQGRLCREGRPSGRSIPRDRCNRRSVHVSGLIPILMSSSVLISAHSPELTPASNSTILQPRDKIAPACPRAP